MHAEIDSCGCRNRRRARRRGAGEKCCSYARGDARPVRACRRWRSGADRSRLWSVGLLLAAGLLGLVSPLSVLGLAPPLLVGLASPMGMGASLGLAPPLGLASLVAITEHHA